MPSGFYKIWLLLFLLNLFTLPVMAMMNGDGEISGYVVDDSTGNPLEDVNVFISGSILGASTDKNGFFNIKYVPEGIHDVVASMVGYNAEMISVILLDKQTRKLSVRLKPMMYQLPVTEIISERPKEWQRNLEKFKSLLFGASEFSDSCEITNSHFLEFEWTDDGVFIARIEKPLEIDNSALGYHIRLLLINFYWNRNEGKLRYIYRSQFSLLKAISQEKEQSWNYNREMAYYGSLMHFLRALKMDNLENQGFRVFHVKEIDQTNLSDIRNFISNPRDYLLKPTLNSGEDVIKFSNFLKINYSRITRKSDLNYGGNLLQVDKPLVSWIKMLVNEVMIDRYGYAEGIDTFETFGYWSTLGVSTMLPKYYIP